MDPRRLGRIQSVFDAAVERPAPERPAFVDRECAGDAELREQVMRLLSAAESTGGAAFIDVAVRRATTEFTEPASRAGLTLGPWRLLRELGHGGMGTVWLAERADGAYDARVAIKLVRGGFASPELERRFRAERQILADLHHPNIAALLGGGDAPDGTPYLVMECIEGEPITEWADRRRLGLAARLRLFRAVCDAVGHAHRSLVVHRDIKPSNILVGEDGVPKLVDFGIAKPLGPEASPDTTALVRRMTPAYASPEQLLGERINVATDVWSLGVLLYELLTGVQPFAAEGMTTEEVRRRILEHEPVPPSEALRRSGGRTGLAPRELAGDLDTIVQMALRKEPAARYASVEQLAEDVRRHLAGAPVSARPATLGYRMRKFAKRNAPAVAAASALFLALAGGLGATLWQARRAEAAQRRAEAALAQSVEVKDFLTSLFRASDPRESRGADVTARELLERGVQRVDELAAQPALQAELLALLGSVQMQLGEYRSAADLYARNETIRRARLGTDDDSLVVQSINMRGRALNMLGIQDSAVMAFEEASTLGRRLLGEEDGTVRAAANNLAISYSRLGRAAEAESIYRWLIPIDRRVLGPDHIDRSYVLNNLGVQLANEGRFTEAEPFLRESLRLRLHGDSADHPATAMAIDNLGMMLREAGRYDDAEPVIRRGLAMRERVLGSEHRMTGESYFSLGTMLAQRGRDDGDYAEADSVLRRGLAVYRSALGPDHPAVAYILHSLGILADRRGDPAESERWYREALVIRRAAARDAPRVTVLTLAALGSVLSRRGAADADTVLREAVALARERVGAADHARSRATVELALHLARRGDAAAAAPLYADGMTALAARIGATHPDVLLACDTGRALELAAAVCDA
ncbi:MAG TPA: serine/threonine-protein kinase [Gemmatimonadaceae bacterium]